LGGASRKSINKHISESRSSVLSLISVSEPKKKKLKLQKEEVQDLRFFSLSKLENELKNYSAKYVPHGDYWSEVIVEIKRKLKIE